MNGLLALFGLGSELVLIFAAILLFLNINNLSNRGGGLPPAGLAVTNEACCGFRQRSKRIVRRIFRVRED